MAKLKRLVAGQIAPAFDLKDIFGRRIKLDDYKDEKLLICFFRYAGCPWCNLAIHRLTMSFPAFDKLNLKVIAFVQSEPENVPYISYMVSTTHC
jgi:peroxiredoxin Q/BCP